jgi:hypothetical protein
LIGKLYILVDQRIHVHIWMFPLTGMSLPWWVRFGRQVDGKLEACRQLGQPPRPLLLDTGAWYYGPAVEGLPHGPGLWLGPDNEEATGHQAGPGEWAEEKDGGEGEGGAGKRSFRDAWEAAAGEKYVGYFKHGA